MGICDMQTILSRGFRGLVLKWSPGRDGSGTKPNKICWTFVNFRVRFCLCGMGVQRRKSFPAQDSKVDA